MTEGTNDRSDIIIEWSGLGKSFTRDGREVPAIEGVDVQIRRGEFVAVVGPSGCGKSTLLNMTAGLMKPTFGEVLYGGGRVSRVNTNVGYMTQNDNLLPWKNVRANVELPLKLRHVPAGLRRSQSDSYLDLVGLAGFEKYFPHELSGGMRKRASLVRTLIYDPETLLMDEPFGALDAQLKLVMQAELLRVWDGTGKTVVFVTHDLAEAIALSDRIVVLGGRPGQLRAICDVNLDRPRDVTGLAFDPRAAEIQKALWSYLRADALAEAERPV